MVNVKTKKQINILREGSKILAAILKKIAEEVKPGVNTGYLEEMACGLIKEAGGRPSFKGYKSGQGGEPFPTALCVSVNNEVVHVPALPARELREGDIVGIDAGMEYPYGGEKRGYYSDMAITAPVGKISGKARKLINVTKKSLELAIEQIKPGNTLNDIARAAQTYVEANGFSVVRGLVGH